MQLIVITPDENVPEETSIVNRMLENGLQRLHIRKSHFTEQEYKDYIMAIDRKYHSKIVIHNYLPLCDELLLGGIHLSSFARDSAAVQQEIAHVAPARVSTSFHSWQEVEENKFEYSYVFISPVFNSISKADYKAAIDMSQVAPLKRLHTAQNKYCPAIIGLGGVEAAQLSTLKDNDFDGGALLGAVWQAKDPLQVYTESAAILRLLTER